MPSFVRFIYGLVFILFVFFKFYFQEAEEFERSWLLLADIYIQVFDNLKLITIMKYTLMKISECD